MTPGARVAAAIEILDEIAAGQPAEQVLTRWSRRSRFAGSGDRAAIRDHVFDALRRWRAAAHEGQGGTGRALMIGLLRLEGLDPADYFTGAGHAPAPPTPQEALRPAAPAPRAATWGLPDWILPAFEASLGPDAERTALCLQTRAPVTLRVNTALLDRPAAQMNLRAQGIETVENTVSETALTVVAGMRRIRTSAAFLSGQVELQDAASQAVVACLPKGARVLDYCAGGGGKALALAVDPAREVFAHDTDVMRMTDLPSRAVRAGARVRMLETSELAARGPFDLVLCDAPCSGSGAWRRAPEGKWLLTAQALEALHETQAGILRKAAALTADDGTLAYATCSVLQSENQAQIDAFLESHPHWRCTYRHQFPVGPEGDGFFTAHLTRKK